MIGEGGRPRGLALLQAETQRRRAAEEAERLRVRARLAAALAGIEGIGAVWVYGSLVRPGSFTRDSDVDVAFESLPAELSPYLVQSLLSAAVGHEVDVCMLAETRLRKKILREGERWT